MLDNYIEFEEAKEISKLLEKNETLKDLDIKNTFFIHFR